MPETPAHLAERLDTEGRKTVEFFRNLVASDWERKLYADGACWTVRQVLAHFVATEAGIGELIEYIRSGGPGVPDDFDIRQYNESQVARLDQASPEDLIQQFAAQRRVTIDNVCRLGDADLSKVGRHPYLGGASLEDIIKLMYRHNQIHQRDIRRELAAGDNEATTSSGAG